MDKFGCIKLANYDKMYKNSKQAVNISCYMPMAGEYSQEMIKTLFGNIKSTSFDMFASCVCGDYAGNKYIGKECPSCGVTVSSVFCKDLEYKGWIMIPGFLPRLIHPQMYDLLARHIYLPKEFKTWGDRKKLTIMDWLLDPTLPIKEMYPNLDNGLTYFNYMHREILEFLLSLPENNNPDLHEFVNKYIDIMLTDKIPVLNEYLHLITHQHGSTKYQVDDSSKYILKVYSSLVSIVNEKELGKLQTVKSTDRRMFKVQQEFWEYPDNLVKSKIISGNGLFRKNCISGRLHYTARAVITPITDLHYGDEVYFPWEIMVTAFKSLILNHLVKRHRKHPQEALLIHSEATTMFGHPLVYQILNAIISETPYKGWPILINRNPTLRHGATTLAFITRVTLSKCINISNLMIHGPNADYDGDMMNVIFIREMDMVPKLINFHPAMMMPSKTEPRISDWIRPPDTSCISMNNFINDVPKYILDALEYC